MEKGFKDHLKRVVRETEDLRDDIRDRVVRGENVSETGSKYLRVDRFGEVVYMKSFGYLKNVLILSSLQDSSDIYIDVNTAFYLHEEVEEYNKIVKKEK